MKVFGYGVGYRVIVCALLLLAGGSCAVDPHNSTSSGKAKTYWYQSAQAVSNSYLLFVDEYGDGSMAYVDVSISSTVKDFAPGQQTAYFVDSKDNLVFFVPASIKQQVGEQWFYQNCRYVIESLGGYPFDKMGKPLLLIDSECGNSGTIVRFQYSLEHGLIAFSFGAKSGDTFVMRETFWLIDGEEHGFARISNLGRTTR